jgi:hypothetical protein
MESTPRPILALVRDLMFSGRISAEARAAGVELKIIRDPAVLEKESPQSSLLIVDMNLPGSIPAAGAWRTKTNGQVIGFVAHTDAQAIAEGKSHGFTEIMPRSKFVTLLPQLLKAHSAPQFSGGA